MIYSQQTQELLMNGVRRNKYGGQIANIPHLPFVEHEVVDTIISAFPF